MVRSSEALFNTGPNNCFIFRIAIFRAVPCSESTTGCRAVGVHSVVRSSIAADNRSAESVFGSLHLVVKKSTLLLSWMPLDWVM